MNNKASLKHQSLHLLNKITMQLNSKQDLDKTLDQVLELVHNYLTIRYCSLTLLNREKNQISIEKAFGLSSEEQNLGKYQVGEGITGKVVESGQALIVPDIWAEPRFVAKIQNRQPDDPISFICVPIKYRFQTIGTLCVEKYFDAEEPLEEDTEVLSIIAFMISEAVSIMQLEQEKDHEDHKKLLEENHQLREALRSKELPTDMIGNSGVMKNTFAMIQRIVNSNITVLVLGESGVGKELIANAIHYNSERKHKPFIKFNCAALPESIIESELFGHERGAFTGAVSSRKGRFELAHEGTIFLDEIGEISPMVQTKLLRVLQEKKFERLGSMESINVDVRIIAATNKNLEELIAAKKFREDLYYRLNVFPIIVPPLRERKTDIPLLIDFFIERYAQELDRNVKRISTPAIDMLMSYHWPGNVRELQNCIERAVLLTHDGVIRSYHLPPTLQDAKSSGTIFKGSLEEALGNLEKEIIVDTLKDAQGNIALASQKVGLTERIMGLRLKKYNINYKDYRKPQD